MSKLYIGIDNGTSGSIGIVGVNYSSFMLTPVKKEQSYTKAKNIISRIDYTRLRDCIREAMEKCEASPEDVMVVLERPLINPTMFKTSMSASRALEATLCVLEELGIPHMYTDSRVWQKVLLPSGTLGSTELKKASVDIASRLFPQFTSMFVKHKDGDGMLIAYWARMEKF